MALCDEYEGWLRHPGNAQAEDEVVGRWHEAIALKARAYSSLITTGPVEIEEPPERHLRAVD